MSVPFVNPFTYLAETQWPPVPSPYAAGVLGMLFHLEQTQWWPTEEIARGQQRQLKVLLDHAYATVPFYRQRFDALNLTAADAAAPDGWSRVPLLTRRDIQTAGAYLHSSTVPKNHGRTTPTTTGGSTGQPVTVLTTEMTDFFWRVLTLRDHFWHRRDFGQPFAAIRYADEGVGQPPAGTQVDSWGGGERNVFPTGPGYLFNIKNSIDEQAAWLHHVNPAYVLSYPSALAGIARVFQDRG